MRHTRRFIIKGVTVLPGAGGQNGGSDGVQVQKCEGETVKETQKNRIIGDIKEEKPLRS